MEFKELLQMAREYTKENDGRQGLRDFLETVDAFSDYELDVFELLREENTVKLSVEKIESGNFQYYEDIYQLVDEWQESECINLPFWLSVDYEQVFENIRLSEWGVFDNYEKPFVIFY